MIGRESLWYDPQRKHESASSREANSREQYSSPATKPEVSPPLLGEADAVLTRVLTGNDRRTQTATAARTRATE